MSLLRSKIQPVDEPVQVQNTAASIMYTVAVSNIAVNQQQAEVTQIASEPLSATPTLQETLNKMMSRMTQMENTMSQMQANVPVPNLQYFQLPNISSNPAAPPAVETISNSVQFEQDHFAYQWEKNKIKTSTFWKGLCDQDFSQSVYLLGDDLPEGLRKAKSWHFLEAAISKRQKTGLVSTKKRPSTNRESLKGLKRELSHVNVIFFLFQGYSDIRESPLLSENGDGRKIIQTLNTNNQDRINGTHSTDIRKGTDSRVSK